ncbi:acyl-CoA dehydrogenase family protein [Phenylobacterium sp. VNQ135]|uniref:acyl-CoA dehydrogenase family protein n=1 Tax=Phenylobacterium sp. VNQ135 TaxID=3400922 RepID=UPI003BFB0E06
MSDLISEQYARLLESLPPEDPWPPLEQSGFLDLLAEVSLEEVFPLALATGARAGAPDVLQAMARRFADPVPAALAATLAAGEMAGSMLAIQALTADYAVTRKQFGREIGKFQAIQHQIAVMAEEVVAARMAAQAAFVGAPADLSERRAAAAKIRCNQAAARVAAIAHAVHGAIGVSEEFVLHHHTRRLRALSLAHGGESVWAVRLGDWALSQAQDFTSLARAL